MLKLRFSRCDYHDDQINFIKPFLELVRKDIVASKGTYNISTKFPIVRPNFLFNIVNQFS